MPGPKLIPSMFHRRLALLGAGVGLASLVLAGGVWRLTVAQGAELRRLAEDRLLLERWTPTVRGSIVDRKGRVLARDEPCLDVLVDYNVITGEWAYTRAARQARRENRSAWPKLTREARAELIKARIGPYNEQLRRMWEDLAQALDISGEELEARTADIRREVQQLTSSVWERWLVERREAVARDREVNTEVRLADVQRPLAVQQQPHPIARGVDEQVGFRVRRLAEVHPGLLVEASGRRVYPFETMDVPVDRSTFPRPLRESGPSVQLVRVPGVATHVLGWMRRLQGEDLSGRPRVDPSTGLVDRGHYQPGDRVGGRGVEGAAEPLLRGLRGRRVEHLDTGLEEVIPPASGGTLSLTLDVSLQARVQALMEPEVGLASVQPWHHPAVIPLGQPTPLPDGTPLNGAAVVLEIDTGEILAMVSTPSFTRRELEEQGEELFSDPVNAAWVNRALAKPYPPGSIIKPLVLTAAVTEGAHRLDTPIECTGHLIPDRPDRYRCWVFKQFNTTHTAQLGRGLLGPEAMAVSCNIYFYTLARALGPERLMAWYRGFGVGEALGLGIGPEYAGEVGQVPKGERLGAAHAILMGIGQGPVAWTPLHAADAYATLARGGLRIKPRLLRDLTPQSQQLRLDPQAVDAALEGLKLSVQADYGTGHTLRFGDGTSELIFTERPGLEVMGKTGTAEAPDILGARGDDDQARAVLREGDHSWFVIMVGRAGGRPIYVISVVMEYAGSGGRVSGPIANQIIGALVAEGYL